LYNNHLSQAAKNANEDIIFGSSCTADDEGLIPSQTQMTTQTTIELSQVRNELKRLGDRADMARAQTMKAQQALKKQVEGIEQQVASVVSAVEKLAVKLDERP
jgi:hypothetical protein